MSEYNESNPETMWVVILSETGDSMGRVPLDGVQWQSQGRSFFNVTPLTILITFSGVPKTVHWQTQDGEIIFIARLNNFAVNASIGQTVTISPGGITFRARDADREKMSANEFENLRKV
jgi:hypothetical protein